MVVAPNALFVVRILYVCYVFLLFVIEMGYVYYAFLLFLIEMGYGYCVFLLFVLSLAVFSIYVMKTVKFRC